MGICICCCCNKKNTNCLENTLIIFTSIEIVFLILGLVLIEWKIAAKINLALYIIILLLLFFSLAILILFKIFREFETIYSKFRKLCYILAILGFSFTILCFFLSVLSESLISEKIYKYDHPCLYRFSDDFSSGDTNSNSNNNNDNSNSNNGNSNSGNTRVLVISNKTKVENDTIIKQICDNNITEANDISSIFWYNKRSAPKDAVMPYICSTIIEILSLIGCFFWYNDIRRIKYCIKHRMNEEKGIIIYGPLGGYLGNNASKTERQIGNEEIIQMKGGNMNLNLNMKVKKGTSSNSYDKNKKNEITNVQNDEVINEINGDKESNKSQNKEDRKVKEDSIYSGEFY